MFEKKEEIRVFETQNAETVVGTSVKLKGNLKSDGDININGSVSGDVRTKASVKVGETANVLANIKAKNVQVSGTVQGNIEAKDTLQILETGKVYGDILAGVLTVSPGAIFSGKCAMNETRREVDLEPILETEEPETDDKEEKKK